MKTHIGCILAPRRLWLVGAGLSLCLVACSTRVSDQGSEPARIGPGDLGESQTRANTVRTEEQQLSRTRTLADLLSRVPGVQVREQEGRLVVRVRNSASFLGGEDPLVLIDGAIYTGAFESIEPAAIESITVLKNADETAVYGARGGNGVILIRTRTGTR